LINSFKMGAYELQYNNLDRIREFAVEFELVVNPVYPMPHMKEMLSRCKDLNVLMGIGRNITRNTHSSPSAVDRMSV